MKSVELQVSSQPSVALCLAPSSTTSTTRLGSWTRELLGWRLDSVLVQPICD